MDASARRVVVDASTALKWRFRDEDAAEQALELLRDYAAGALERLFEPPLIDYEITNALRTGVLKGRLSETEALAALSDFAALSIERPAFQDTQPLALQLACRFGRSAYDAAYLALAQVNGTWFFTGDRRLFNAVGSQLDYVRWIGDYSLESVLGQSV